MKKLIALVFVVLMLVNIAVVPVSAVNIYEEDRFMGLIEVYDYGNEEDKTFFEKIKDTFHWYIARIFIYFEADCPICGEHFDAPYFDDAAENHYNKAVNDLKMYKGLVTVKKTRTVNITVGDAPGAIENILNHIAESLSGKTTETYRFLDGKDAQGREITDVIQPLGRNAELTEDAINGHHLSFTPYAEKIRSLTISLVEEKSLFDGTVIHNSDYNSSVIEAINPATLELGPLKIINAEITYPETLVSASFDDKIRATSIKIEIPLDACITGYVSVIKFTCFCNAEITEEYTITYA